MKKNVIKKWKEIEEEYKKEAIEKKGEEKKTDLKKFYNDCVKILKFYIDMEEKYYSIIALWLVGTYFHKQFPTFPYLYINAVKGSGKTRLLKLISHLAWNGKMQMDLTDATLFRLSETSTFCIDELENINRKEKSTLRLLLNAAYKKGVTVPRMVKILGKMELEEFPLFCPIAMANIWGLDDVLQDRCINIHLDKSSNRNYTKLLEDFHIIKRITGNLVQFGAGVDTISENAYTYYNTITTHHTPIYTHTHNYTKLHPFFIRVKDSNLEGRHLELFFPLLLIAWKIDLKVFENNLLIFEEMAKKKTSDEVFENRDITLLDYLYQREEKPEKEYIAVSEILKGFREWLHEGDEKDIRWLNTLWVGRSLKRLGVIIIKRRLRKGVEVMIDFDKAKDKLAKFKELPVETKEDQKELDENKSEKIEE